MNGGTSGSRSENKSDFFVTDNDVYYFEKEGVAQVMLHEFYAF